MDEFNFNTIFICNVLGICADLFCKGIGESRKNKNAVVAGFQIAGHVFGMVPSRDIILDDHATKTDNRTMELVGIFICK